MKKLTPKTPVREVRQELFKYDSKTCDDIRRQLFEKENQDAPVGLFFFAEAKEAIKKAISG